MKHLGFHGAGNEIMRKEHLSRMSANAILAAGARKASASAKRKNPRLNKVRGHSKY